MIAQIKNEVLELVNNVLKDKFILYPSSLLVDSNAIFFIAKDMGSKYIFVLGNKADTIFFDGAVQENISFDNKEYTFKKAFLNYSNLKVLRTIFPHLNPATCPGGKSFGTGDRLGLVTPAHIKSFEDKDIFPILAQQSARELIRTERSWEDVINDASWGYFESGSRIFFGADADHIKETGDLKKAVDAGFTMFTVDPSDYIQNILQLDKFEISKIYYSIDKLAYLENKYLGKNVLLGDKKYYIDQDILMPIVVKYKRALDRVSSLYIFLKGYKKGGFDFEVSMDEIEEPVTPLEHYFIANELADSGINFHNLALRFTGRWEKAIDYIGNIELFKSELKKHVEIINIFNTYKLSLHSGSEKLSTYPIFSKLTEGNFHIKTAGTSWLEALRTIAEKSPALFRRIYAFSFECFEKDRDSYHLSTDISNLADIDKVSDENLTGFLNWSESRQILHVTFGSILTAKDKDDIKVFKDDLYRELFNNEDTHYKYVSLNIKKHLNLLNN